MLALHIWAIVNLAGDCLRSAEQLSRVASALRFAGLTASTLFFVLKLFDVAWLRLKPGWRSMIVSIGVIGLLHVGVVQRGGAAEFIGSPVPASAMCLIGGAVGAQGVRRAVEGCLAYRSNTGAQLLNGKLYRRLACDDSLPLVIHFIRPPMAPRAPPVW